MTTRELAAALQANEVVKSDTGLLHLSVVDSCTLVARRGCGNLNWKMREQGCRWSSCQVSSTLLEPCPLQNHAWYHLQRGNLRFAS